MKDRSYQRLNQAACDLLNEIGLPPAVQNWNDKAFDETYDCRRRAIPRTLKRGLICPIDGSPCLYGKSCDVTHFIRNNSSYTGNSTSGAYGRPGRVGRKK